VSDISWYPPLAPSSRTEMWRSPKVNTRYLSCHRTVSHEGIEKNEKDYRNVARKLNTEKLEEKLMRIAVGDVTVNTNGHARPFLRFRTARGRSDRWRRRWNDGEAFSRHRGTPFESWYPRGIFEGSVGETATFISNKTEKSLKLDCSFFFLHERDATTFR